jgi:hypothetical protein
MNENYGWHKDPAEVSKVQSRLSDPAFLTSICARSSAEIPSEVFLWKAAEQILGQKLPGRNQGQVGSCVSFGTAAAIEHSMLAEIALGDLEEFKELCQEEIYGGSRVEIGGGRLKDDGSIGAWAAEYVNKFGILARGKYGNIDCEKYDETLCRKWGAKGVPPELLPEIKIHPVKTTSLVRDFNEAKKALASGYGIAVCSNQGFNGMDRDSAGFATAKGEWGHCMALIGYQTGNRPGGFILNSWGDDAHHGPTGAGDPPLAGFWVDSKIIDRMLAEQDSWAFSCVEGFPIRKLHFLI